MGSGDAHGGRKLQKLRHLDCRGLTFLLPALDGAPIVHLTVANVLAECTAIAHVVEHDPRIMIVNYELTAERQMILKCVLRIFCGRSEGDEQVAQHQ
jgi:hypothetical protein